MNYRSVLTENILPFWLKTAIDYENGGIFTQLDKKGVVYDTDNEKHGKRQKRLVQHHLQGMSR